MHKKLYIELPKSAKKLPLPYLSTPILIARCFCVLTGPVPTAVIAHDPHGSTPAP